MKKYDEFKKWVCRATSLSVLVMLTACGGSDDSSEQNECLDNIIVLIICSVVSSSSTAPDQAPTSPAGSGVAGKSPALAGSGDLAIGIAQVDEFEPNNMLDNANVVTLPGSLTDDPRGVEIRGNLHSFNDVADHFVFAPHRSGTYRFYLCADTCDDSLEDDAGYVMIYDQNQTTIAGTPVGTDFRQEVTADLTAGFAYYVEVNGYNAGTDRYGYRLVLTE